MRLTIQPLTKNDALSMGMRAVDQTVARTFKISKANRQAKGASTDYYWNANKYKVRPPIRKGRFVPKTNIYIEKSKYAIDTPGEHRGITVKGWKVRQANKKGRLF